MATFGTLKHEIIRLLEDVVPPSSDPIEGTQTPAELLLFAVRAAMVAVSQRVWKQSILEVTGGLSEIAAPDAMIDAEAILDLTEKLYLSRAQLMEGESSDTGITWIDYPSGFITFSGALGAEGAKIYYSSVWEIADDTLDTDPLETPAKLLPAMAYYGASYCMLARASGSSNIRQFGTKVDSGAPTDIPQKLMADTFMKSFERELMRLPANRKGSS